MTTCPRVLVLVSTLIAGGFSIPPAFAQDTKGLGVVTTLTGQATVARPTQSQPLPLHFKDDVYGRDRISTAEKSLVRVLLGGKAVVTVRELSVLTISEDLGHADINLQSGKVALAVAHQRMKPGESITLRARNAVAAIRGTVVIAEVLTATAQLGQPAQASGGIGVFHVLNGTVEVTPPGGNPFIVTSGQSGDGTGRVWTRTPSEDAAIRQGLTTDQRSGSQPDNTALLQKQAEQAAALSELIAPGPEQTGPTIPTATICPPTCSVMVPHQPPPPNTANLIQNPGAEDVLANWSPTGATSSNPTFGFINSPEGRRMFVISTGNGSVNGTASTLTQGFSSTGDSVFALGFRSAFASTELGRNPSFNDTFQATAIDSAGNQALLAMESRNTSAFSLQGLINDQNYGVTDFRTWAKTWVTTTTDTGILHFQVFNVGDTAFDSTALVDSVFAYKVTPVFLIRNGAQLVTAAPVLSAAPLAEWIGQPPVSFDSLMVLCCHGSAILGGRLLHAKDTDLDVPFTLLSVVQGGQFRAVSPDSLVLLEGGNHAIGTQVGIFDLSGVNTALDASTGIVLGTEQPLTLGSFPRPLFETSGAQVNTRKVIQLDTALLEASAPLIWAHNASSITTSQDAIDLSFRARVASIGSVVRLDSSTLTVANGSAINVAASVLRVTGDLFTLLNGSTLNVLNGALLSASGGSNVFVSGALIAFGGTGGNLVSVTNNFCAAGGCQTIGGIVVALAGGATASQVSIGPSSVIKNGGLGSVSTNGALIRVVGPTTRVSIAGGS
jgi:hypothetical protein